MDYYPPYYAHAPPPKRHPHINRNMIHGDLETIHFESARGEASYSPGDNKNDTKMRKLTFAMKGVEIAAGKLP